MRASRIEITRERALCESDTPTRTRRGASHANLCLLRLLCSVYVYLLPIPQLFPFPLIQCQAHRCFWRRCTSCRERIGATCGLVLFGGVRVIEAVIKTLQGRGPATIRNSIVILRQPAHCEGVFQIVKYVYSAGLVSNWHIATISASSTNCSLRGTLNENNKMADKFIEH